jgi:hypothetical protein
VNLLQRFQPCLAALFRKWELAADMDDEMRSHIEMRTQANIAWFSHAICAAVRYSLPYLFVKLAVRLRCC